MRKAKFYIEDSNNCFDGYDDKPHSWNGWSTPCFTFEQAQALMDIHNLSYDEKTDSFTENDEPEYSYKAEQRIIDGKSTKIYPIGSCCWTWEKI